jgi:transcriptional regulator with XRE-family HTH domain
MLTYITIDMTSKMTLKEARTKQGLTQARLADMVGVHERSVTRWESGGTIDGQYYKKAAEAYGCKDIEQLIELSEYTKEIAQVVNQAVAEVKSKYGVH